MNRVVKFWLSLVCCIYTLKCFCFKCRWILKTDYLTASSEAGKFLKEEDYEWHENCLNDDGAINLEAPRKWRLLRQRTGHGAFYGMRIIIYGDCIAPSLVCVLSSYVECLSHNKKKCV